MSENDKVTENRLRRAAARRGQVLVKSRRRDPHALGYGKYWLRDMFSGAITAGGAEHEGLTLEEIGQRLAQKTSG